MFKVIKFVDKWNVFHMEFRNEIRNEFKATSIKADSAHCSLLWLLFGHYGNFFHCKLLRFWKYLFEKKKMFKISIVYFLNCRWDQRKNRHYECNYMLDAQSMFWKVLNVHIHRFFEMHCLFSCISPKKRRKEASPANGCSARFYESIAHLIDIYRTCRERKSSKYAFAGRRANAYQSLSTKEINVQKQIDDESKWIPFEVEMGNLNTTITR